MAIDSRPVKKETTIDPITAVALATKAIAEMITEIVRGQPPELRAQMWEWWVTDQKAWRRLLKMDPPA